MHAFCFCFVFLLLLFFVLFFAFCYCFCLFNGLGPMEQGASPLVLFLFPRTPREKMGRPDEVSKAMNPRREWRSSGRRENKKTKTRTRRGQKDTPHTRRKEGHAGCGDHTHNTHKIARAALKRSSTWACGLQLLATASNDQNNARNKQKHPPHEAGE